MRVIAVDDDPTILRTIVNVLSELDNSLEIETFPNPYLALEAVEIKRPEMVLIDKMMKPIEGTQLKRYIDAIEEYDPFCVMISGVPEYGLGFDMYVVKELTVSKLQFVLDRYKNRTTDYLRDYLETKFDKKTQIDFLYDLIKTKEIERHDLLSELMDRIALFLDIKPDSARRRLFKIIEDNKNVFNDDQHYSPTKFLEKLKLEYKLYFQNRIFSE